MLSIKRLFLVLLCSFVCISSAFAQKKAPTKERYIILWDVSGSLLSFNGNGPSVDEYTGKGITSSLSGNGLWMPLKKALIKSVNSIKNNSESEIIVVPFYSKPLCEWRVYATNEGKNDIINKIEHYDYPRGEKTQTNIVKALAKFEEIVQCDCSDYINYLFLYTDGAHENNRGRTTSKEWNDLRSQITSFDNYATTEGRYIYRFYYLVSDKADPDGVIKTLESDNRKFWVVDSLVSVKFVNLSKPWVDYNVCANENKGIKKSSQLTIPLDRDCRSFLANGGNIIFKSDDDYYKKVECALNDTTIVVKEVCPKDGVALPSKHEITVQCSLLKNDKLRYYYLLDSKFKINCIYTPEKGVALSLKNAEGKSEVDKYGKDVKFDIGKTSYYPSFFGKSGKATPLDFSLSAKFDSLAKSRHPSLEVSFADSDGKPLEYKDFKIVVNGKDTLKTSTKCCIDSNQDSLDFTIVPSETAETFAFKGCLIVSEMHNIDRINGIVPNKCESVVILPWTFKHNRKWNPLLRNIVWFIISLLILLFIIYLIFKARAYLAPHFPAGSYIAFVVQDSESHNFVLTYKQLFEGCLVIPGSNVVATHILKDSYIQKIMLSDSERDMPFQTTIGEKWNGRIIHVTADFYNQLISSIELVPIRAVGIPRGLWIDLISYITRTPLRKDEKYDVKVIVKYKDGSKYTIERIGLSRLNRLNTDTELRPIKDAKVGVQGRGVAYFNQDDQEEQD